jgi:hypothetical protein
MTVKTLDARELTVEELDWVGGGGDRVDAIMAGAAIGAGIGAPAGGAVGTMIGAGFAGVGAVPGSAIGAGVGWLVGGIGGAIAGGFAGNSVFDWATKPPASGGNNARSWQYRIV